MSGEPASSGHGPLEEPAIIPHPTRVGVWLIPDTEQGRAVIAQVPPARQPWPAERAHARILGSNALGILAGYTVFMAALAVMDQDLGLPLWLLWLLMALIAFRAVWSLTVKAVKAVSQCRNSRARRLLEGSGIACPAPLPLWGPEGEHYETFLHQSAHVPFQLDPVPPPKMTTLAHLPPRELSQAWREARSPDHAI